MGPSSIEFNVRAPGRVNLIGEHVDYAGGLVLPAAIDLGLTLRGRSRRDGAVRLRSLAFAENAEIGTDPAAAGSFPRWGSGAAVVLALLRERGLPAGGFEGTVAGDLPMGGGLSSSAAFLVSVALAAWASAGAAPPDDRARMDLAVLCRDAEERARGVRCGIMDPAASLLGREGAALLIDCRSQEVAYVPVDPGRMSLLVVDSGLERDLSAGGYNRRRAECDEAAALLGVSCLRDASREALTAGEKTLGPVLFRRARHVASEIERTLRAVGALRRGDAETFGHLLFESHESLRLDFEVSTPELDALVAIAGSAPGTLGARLVGGGFGGNVLVVVRPGAEEVVAETIAEGSRRRLGREAPIRAVRPSARAGIDA